MNDLATFKLVFKVLALPPTGLLLSALIGLAMIRRHPRAGSALSAASVGVLLALSTPIVASALVRLLDKSPPLDLAVARTAQAIVIPGGGVRRNAAEYGGDTLGRLSLERVRYGARLAKQTGLPVLVTGGSVLGDSETEAALMRKALTEEFGVPVRWIESRSRNTRENAQLSAEILKAADIQTIVLVMHSFDVPRTTLEYERAGIRVIPAPTGIFGHEIELPMDLMPGITGLNASYFACYEFAALAVSRLTRN